MGFKIIFTKENMGQKYPLGYGLAYHDYQKVESYLYPIPFNWIIKLIRDFWFILLEPPESIKEKAWQDGYLAGTHDFLQIEKDKIKNEIEKEIRQDIVNKYVEELTKIWTK